MFAPALADLLGPARGKDEPLEQRHKDIARSVQAMYEEAFFHLLNALHARHRLERVAIAGGCGMNSVANGKVTLQTPFTRGLRAVGGGRCRRRDRRGLRGLARAGRRARPGA